MYLILIAGHTGQGKTPYLNSTFLKNESVPNPENKEKRIYYPVIGSNKQYIFDVNDEYRLPVDSRKFDRMRHIDCDIEIFMDKCKELKGFNIVIEDATGFLRGKQNAKFARLLTGKIFSKNNYILIFHSINRIPPELMEMANFLILFKTNDNIDLIDRKFKNEKVNAAFLRLRNKPRFSKEKIKLI